MAVEDLAFVPLCMTPLELGEWRSSNRALLLREQAARPCTDCPLGFAADMRAQGRCNGTPGGVAADPDEPEEEDTMEPAVVRADAGRRTAVALTAPCGGCEKADVCSLRASIEAIASLPVLVPVLDPRVGLELAGSVTCSAFVKARIRKADAGELDAKPKRQMSAEGRAAIAAGAQARRARERAEREAVPA